MHSANLLQQRVLRAAKAWWEGHRPVNYSEQQHLANPVINMCGDTLGTEHALGRAVVALMKSGWQADQSKPLVLELYCALRVFARGGTPEGLPGLLRRAEVLLERREVNEDTTPQPKRAAGLGRRR